MVVNGTGDLGAAARAAAQEAARRAAEEARRRAEEAARKRAEEEAHTQAQAQAKQAANAARQLDKLNHTDSLQADKVTARLVQQVKPVTNDEAKAAAADLEKGLKSVKSPEDLSKLASKASELSGRASASDIDPAVAKHLDSFSQKIGKADQAVQSIEQDRTSLNGSPTERAATTANLLAHPNEFQKTVQDLKALEGSPMLDRAKASVDDIVAKATPEKLAQQLNAQPDPTQYPPGLTNDLATLRGLPDPALQVSIDKVGVSLLNQGISARDVHDHSEYGAILAPLQQSDDPALKQQLLDTVKGWANDSMTQALDGKERESGAKEAISEYQDDMVNLAKATGLGPTIQEAATQVANDRKGDIEDVAKKGKHWYEKIGDIAGDLVGDLGGAIGKSVNFLGDVGGAAIKVAAMPMEGELALASKAFSAVGLDGAAKMADAAHDGLKAGADFVGDTTQSFVHGVGDATKGLGDGVKFMVQHPLQAAEGLGNMVVHPELMVDAAKVMWQEANKGGLAHAAGYMVGNLAPMLVGGGEASLVGRAAELAKGSDLAMVARAGEAMSTVADYGGRFTQATMAINKLDFGKLGGALKGAKAAEAATEAGEGAAKASTLSRAAEALKSPAESTKAGLQAAKAGLKEAHGTAKETLGNIKDGLSALKDHDVKTAVGHFSKAADPVGKVADHVGNAVDFVTGAGQKVEEVVTKHVGRRLGNLAQPAEQAIKQGLILDQDLNLQQSHRTKQESQKSGLINETITHAL